MIGDSDLTHLKSVYKDYITRVSAEGFAMSLPCMLFLFENCLKHKPKVAVDFGSGLSSFTLRYYKQQYCSDMVVYSVETNNSWRKKSKGFCNEHNLDDSNFMSLGHFDGIPAQIFDLAFIDIALGRHWNRRSDCLRRMLNNRSDSETIYILDDFQTERMRNKYAEALTGYTYDMIDVKDITLDTGDGQWIRYSGYLKNVVKIVD